MNKLNYSSIKIRKFSSLIILFIFAILNVPNLLRPIQPGLDGSWILGLHLAHLENFIWGKDVSFTYGPLSYLYYPLNINSNLWLESIFFTIISVSLFYLVLGFFVLKTKSPIRNALVLGFISAVLYNITFPYLSLLGLLLGFYLYLQHCKNPLLLIPITFSSAFLFFLKFDVALISLSFVFISCIYFLQKNRKKDFLLCTVSYVFFIGLIWFLISGSFSGIENYFLKSLLIASDYTESASITLPLTFLVYFIIPSVILYFWWILESWKKDKQNLKFLFLSSFALFAFYKIGFIREGHMHLFFALWGFIFFVIYASSNTNKVNKILRYATIVFVGILILFVFVSISVLKSPNLTLQDDIYKWAETLGGKLSILFIKSGIQQFDKIIEFVIDEDLAEKIRLQQKNNIMTFYPPIEQSVLSMIENKTVSIYPWDIVLLYSYDLEWVPSPFLQNHVGVVNNKLDNMDAEFYKSENSPEYIIFILKAIDNRHPSFVEPSTLRSIMCNYHIISSNNQLQILQNNEKNVCTEEQTISKMNFKFNQKITVPENDSGYTFAKIKVERNSLGNLAKIFYKPPHVFIQLNDQEKQYRFTYPNAENGIILTKTQNNKLPLILANDVKSFIITTTDERFFNQNLEIEFFKINVNN